MPVILVALDVLLLLLSFLQDVPNRSDGERNGYSGIDETVFMKNVVIF